MASNEDALSVVENKKCKYCKSGVDKAGVKCLDCAVCFHPSCALRITGLQVASGSKSLITCAACSKMAREDEIHKAVSEKNKEIDTLKKKIATLESEFHHDLFAEVYKRMEAMENSILGKISSLEKKVNKPSAENAVSSNSPGGSINATNYKHQELLGTAPISERMKPTASYATAANAENSVATNSEQMSDADEADANNFRTQKKRGWNRNVRNLTSENVENDKNKQEKVQRSWNDFLRRKKGQRKTGTNNDFGDFEADKKPNKDKKIWLFITKVKNTITEEVVKNYISKKSNLEPRNIEVKQCQTKSENTNFNCFMVGVDPDLKEVVYEDSFWPAGVGFQRFDFSLGRNFLEKRLNRSMQTPTI